MSNAAILAQATIADIRHYGATVLSTDNSAAINAALAANKEVFVPPGNFQVAGTLSLSAGQMIHGMGWSSILTFTTPNVSCISASAVTGAIVRDLKIVVTGTGTASYIGVVIFTGSTACRAENLDISGNSGCGIFVQDSSKCIVKNNYLHDFNLVNGNADQADIYLGIGTAVGTRYCIVDGNICFGGGWHGVMILTGAGAITAVRNEYNQITNNRIGQHAAYGISDYCGNGHFDLYNQISGNFIENIQGSVLGGSSGAGIYCVAGGGNVISDNNIRNCCVLTSNASLVPGGIGVGDCQSSSPHTISGNVITGMTNYHGIMVSSCPTGAIVTGNSVEIEAGNGVGSGITINSSSNTVVANNTIDNLAANAAILLQASITINNNSILGNLIKSAGVGIGTNIVSGSPFFQKTLINNNNINVSVGSTAINLQSVAQGSLANNTAFTQVATCVALAGCTALRVTGNYFACNGTFALNISGVGTDVLIDESNYLSGASNSYMNAVTDSSAGAVALVAQYGAAVPTAGVHQIGHRVIQSASVIGNPKGWRCTTGGTPGTWTSEGNL